MASFGSGSITQESWWFVAHCTDIRLCCHNSNWYHFAYLAHIEQNGANHQPNRCSFHSNFSRLCYRSGCGRHRHLLEFFRTGSRSNIISDWGLWLYDQCYRPFPNNGAADWTSGKIAHRRIHGNDKPRRHGQDSKASGNIHPDYGRHWSYYPFCSISHSGHTCWNSFMESDIPRCFSFQ